MRADDEMTECVDQRVDLVLVVLANCGDTDPCDRIDRVAGCSVWQDRRGAAPEPERIVGVAELVDVELERIIM